MNKSIDHNEDEMETTISQEDKSEILTNLEYICKSTKLITEALSNGCDIAQLPNGDVMITETRIVHMYYTWDKIKEKMTRIS